MISSVGPDVVNAKQQAIRSSSSTAKDSGSAVHMPVLIRIHPNIGEDLEFFPITQPTTELPSSAAIFNEPKRVETERQALLPELHGFILARTHDVPHRTFAVL